jgi:hypothetical protein
MSGVENAFARGSEDIASVFGWRKSSSSKVASVLGAKSPYLPAGRIQPPPTTDTAANDSLQQQQQLARQKGVLATIFAGNNASQPTVATKSLLGG